TTAPDWWNSVPLNYPPTLDLTWTDPKPKEPWTPSKNVGQYFWSVINENPGKWREGVKLGHHLLSVNKDNPAVLHKVMNSLGGMYHNLLGDWARAAFWWRKAGYTDDIDLAHCYWKLGSREMALAILNKFPADDTRHGSIIKLWADMGDFDKALALAETTAREEDPDVAFLAAGDACRMAGRYAQALAYYQKVLTTPAGQRDFKQNKNRAQASIDAIGAAEGLDLSKVRDGEYTATSMGYAGPLDVAVEIKGGKILSVKVTRHQEKQFYTALTDTPAQIVARQGIKGVDAVTSATITSEAIMNATVKALAKGMQ
ncbi:MAG: FMN-binding protein, partial [Planctomycetota bacterium]|nr:FMN-binding protein [Planctomycetota bacterium]